MRELRVVQGIPVAGPRTIIPALFIALGAGSFVVAAVLIAAWSHEIVRTEGFESPEALATTHVLALGFCSSIAIGVLYHLAPRAFGASTPSPVLGLAVWCCYVASLVGFVVSLATSTYALSAIAGPLLAIAVVGFLAQMANVARRGKRRSLTCNFMLGSFIAFMLVAVIGSLLAMSLQFGFVKDPNPWLGAKMFLAVGGWLGLLIVGVSYQIIPMFTLSRGKQRFGTTTLALMSCSLIAAPVTLMFQAPPAFRIMATLPYCAGLAIYVSDVMRFMRNRLRQGLTPVAAGHAAGAVLLLADSLCAIPAVWGVLPWPQIAVCGALLGWVPCFIVASAFRIIPALLWEARGPGRRARVPVALPPWIGWIAISCAIPLWPATALGFASQSSLFGLIAAGLAVGASGSLVGAAILSWKTASGDDVTLLREPAI